MFCPEIRLKLSPSFMTDDNTDTCTGWSFAVSLAFWPLYSLVKARRIQTENRNCYAYHRITMLVP